MQLCCDKIIRLATFRFLLFFALWPHIVDAQIKIGVQILDIDSNSPISGAEVEIHETGQRFTFTGSALVLEVEKGNYHLHFEAPGYEASDYNLVARKDTSLTFYLKPTFVELKEVLVEESSSKTLQQNASLSIERINYQESEKALEASFAESLKKLPGLEAYNTGVGISKPIIRGFTATRVSVYDQGIKQEGQQWGMDHGLEIDPFSAERIEIVKGPGALQYGSDATGGLIKLLPEPLPQKGFSGNYTGLYKSNNNTLGSSVKLAYRKKEQFLTARFSYQQYDDYRIPAEEFIYNSFVLPVVDNRLKNTAGELLSYRLNYGLQKSTYNARLMFSQYRQNVGLYPGATGIPRAFDVANIGDVSDIGLPNQEVTHTKVYGKLNVMIGHNWLTTDFGYQLNVRQENSNPHAHGLEEIEEGNTAALRLNLQTFSLNSKYSWKNKGLKYNVGTNHQLQQNVKGGWEYLLPDFISYNGGAYALIEGFFDENWSWNSGLRLDYGYNSSEEHLQPWYNDLDSLVLRSPKNERNFFNYALGLGLVYKPGNKWNINLNLAKSFRIPVAAELVSNGVHHGTFRHEVGTPDLDAEEAYQLDLGISYFLKDFYFKLTPFFNYFTNYIYLRPTGSFSPLPDAGQLYRYSQTKAIHSGGELFAEYHIIEQLHLSTAIEYVYNINLETNLPLPFTPPLSNLLSLEYDIIETDQFSWSFTAEHRLTASQERVDRNEDITPSYQLINLKSRIKFKLKKSEAAAGISVLNLTNTSYLNHLSRYRILNLPEQGRNIVLNLSIGF